MNRSLLVMLMIPLVAAATPATAQSAERILRPCFYSKALRAGHVLTHEDVFVNTLDLRPYAASIAQRVAEYFITERMLPLLVGRRLARDVTPGQNLQLKDFEEERTTRDRRFLIAHASPNQSLQLTATRRESSFSIAKTVPVQLTLGFGGRS